MDTGMVEDEDSEEPEDFKDLTEAEKKRYKLLRADAKSER